MKIYVDWFPDAMGEERLRKMFERYGRVQDVVIKTRPYQDRYKYALVDMPDDDEAQAALSGLDGFKIENRFLVVNVSRPFDEPR